MGGLERTKVGRFDIKNTVTLEKLRELTHEDIQKLVTPIDEAVDFFPAVRINDYSSRLIKNGCAVDIRKLRLNAPDNSIFRLYDSNGFFGIGIVEKHEDILALRQKKLFFGSPSST